MRKRNMNEETNETLKACIDISGSLKTENRGGQSGNENHENVVSK